MPAAAAIPSIIGIGGSLLSGVIGSSASKNAAKTQAAMGEAVGKSIDKATGQAIDAGYTGLGDANSAYGSGRSTLGDVYHSLNGTIDPYLKAGQQGVTQLSTALAPGGDLTKQFSFNPSDLTSDPGYEFQLNEGLKALQNSAAAKGGLSAGGTQKSMMNYAQGLAGTSFQNAYNRASNTFQMNRSNTLNGLQMLTGVGQNAVNQSIGVGENYGGMVNANYGAQAGAAMQGNQYVGNVGLQGAQLAGQARLGEANATAAGQVGAGNAWSSAVNGMSGGFASLAGAKWGNTGGGGYGRGSGVDIYGRDIGG